MEIVIKPQYLRNLCWTDEPRKRDVARFLSEQGARDWQVSPSCRVRKSRYYVEVA